MIILLLIVCAASYGQVCLKRATQSVDSLGFDIILNLQFIAGVALYAFCSLAWLWVLRVTSLSQAYPVLGLTFILVPVFSAVFLNEQVSTSYFLGAVLIVAGITVITSNY